MSGKNQTLGFFPTNAAIRNRHAILEFFQVAGEWLIAGMHIAFQHQADNIFVSGQSLGETIIPADVLQQVIFVGVGMTAVDHEPWWQLGRIEPFQAFLQTIRTVVWTGSSPAQDQKSPGVSLGVDDTGLAFAINSQKTVLRSGCQHRVNRDL